MAPSATTAPPRPLSRYQEIADACCLSLVFIESYWLQRPTPPNGVEDLLAVVKFFRGFADSDLRDPSGTELALMIGRVLNPDEHTSRHRAHTIINQTVILLEEALKTVNGGYPLQNRHVESLLMILAALSDSLPMIGLIELPRSA